MGMVAAALVSLIAHGSTGKYIILYERNPKNMKQKSEVLAKTQPPAVDDGKIRQGYLPLTPVNDETHFHACLIVERDTERP